MVKKIFGILFIAVAILYIIGGIANGTLFADQESVAATYGTFVGKLIVVSLFAFSGITLLTFDNSKKMNYIDGFKKRSKQNSKFMIFIVIYTILFFLMAMGVALNDLNNFLLSFIIKCAPYYIPLAVFAVMYMMYAIPHKTSKKYFVNNEEALKEYLSENVNYVSCSEDNSVLSSDKALFFPDLFCVIPFSQISSVTLIKELWEQDVFFNLTNGKKFYIVSNNFDNIKKAIENNKQ